MNKKQTVIMCFAIVWVFGIIFYISANPPNFHPAQQDQSFSQLSGYAKGYLDTMNSAVKTSMPKLP